MYISYKISSFYLNVLNFLEDEKYSSMFRFNTLNDVKYKCTESETSCL